MTFTAVVVSQAIALLDKMGVPTERKGSKVSLLEDLTSKLSVLAVDGLHRDGTVYVLVALLPGPNEHSVFRVLDVGFKSNRWGDRKYKKTS